jgi:hypothetical protein
MNLSAENSSRPFTAVDIPPGMFKRAEAVLLTYAAADIGTIDALHIAIAERLRLLYTDLALVTSDRGMLFVCKDLGLATLDPKNQA